MTDTETANFDEHRTLTVVAVGDTMVSRRLRINESDAFMKLVELLRSADVAFANLEGPIRDPNAYPVKQATFGSFLAAEPWLAEELAWMGFNMISLANNHMSDFSYESVLTNIRLLGEAGIVSAGAAMSLGEARQPQYLDLPTARIALLAVDSSFEHGELRTVQMASDPSPGVPARPGVNGLRWDEVHLVGSEALSQLQKIRDSLGGSLFKTGYARAKETGDLEFFGTWFREGHPPAILTWCDARDVADIRRWVANARAQADCVVVSHHFHESKGQRREFPPDYAREFAHAVVDAGADAYIGHGSYLKGIEIYNGKPLFHCVGTFAQQVESQRRHPASAYDFWGLDAKATPAEFADARRRDFGDDVALPTGFVARFTMKQGAIVAVEGIPTEVTAGNRYHDRGTPIIARADIAEEVAAAVIDASKPYGTEMTFQSGVVRVDLDNRGSETAGA